LPLAKTQTVNKPENKKMTDICKVESQVSGEIFIIRTFIVLFRPKYFSNDDVKKDGIGGALARM
jgi:hypothetical protein